jgi:hypothetical protein
MYHFVLVDMRIFKVLNRDFCWTCRVNVGINWISQISPKVLEALSLVCDPGKVSGMCLRSLINRLLYIPVERGVNRLDTSSCMID